MNSTWYVFQNSIPLTAMNFNEDYLRTQLILSDESPTTPTQDGTVTAITLTEAT